MNTIHIINYNPETHNILLESDDAIITTNSKDIFMVEKTDENTFVLFENNERVEIHNSENEYLEFIQKIGFIQIHPTYAVNPEKIRTFRTKTLEIEIDNNHLIPVNERYKRNLINSINRLKYNLVSL